MTRWIPNPPAPDRKPRFLIGRPQKPAPEPTPISHSSGLYWFQPPSWLSVPLHRRTGSVGDAGFEETFASPIPLMHTPYAAFRGKNGLRKSLAPGATILLVSLLHFSCYFKDCEALSVSLRFTSETQSRRNELVFPSVDRFQPSVRAFSSTSCEPSVAFGFQHYGLSPQTHARHAPLTNFSVTLPRPLHHELRFLASLQATHSIQFVQLSISELPGVSLPNPRRSYVHSGFAPVARLTSHTVLRSCFRPGTRMGFAHQPSSNCPTSRKRKDTGATVPTASRQRLEPADDTQPDILRIYPLLKEP